MSNIEWLVGAAIAIRGLNETCNLKSFGKDRMQD